MKTIMIALAIFAVFQIHFKYMSDKEKEKMINSTSEFIVGRCVDRIVP